MELPRASIVFGAFFLASCVASAVELSAIELTPGTTVAFTRADGKSRTYEIESVEKAQNSKTGRMITGRFCFEYPDTCDGRFVGYYSATSTPKGQRISMNGVAMDGSPSGITTPQASGWLRTSKCWGGGVVAVLTTADPTGNSAETATEYEVH